MVKSGMRQKSRKLPDFDLSTTCTECGEKIQPPQIVRLDFDRQRCPYCGKVFVETSKSNTSQLGGSKWGTKSEAR
jgi:predicted RNA-binding Zn-ribbon protein involved in translation (DUF1610 family)